MRSLRSVLALILIVALSGCAAAPLAFDATATALGVGVAGGGLAAYLLGRPAAPTITQESIESTVRRVMRENAPAPQPYAPALTAADIRELVRAAIRESGMPSFNVVGPQGYPYYPPPAPYYAPPAAPSYAPAPAPCSAAQPATACPSVAPQSFSVPSGDGRGVWIAPGFKGDVHIK